MVKTNKNSFFVLYNLSDIRSSRQIILQIEDTDTKFDDGHKCYLCEVVSPGIYSSIRDEQDLTREICTLNAEKRKLEKKVIKLEKKIADFQRKEE